MNLKNKLEILKKKNCLLKKMKTMQVGFLRSCFVVVVFWEARSCQPPQQVCQVCTLPPNGAGFHQVFFPSFLEM